MTQEVTHHTHHPGHKPTQWQAPLTNSHNLVDSYTRVPLYVVHTNLMLQPSGSMPRPRLGVSELQLQLRLQLHRDLCGRVGGGKQQCPFLVRAVVLVRYPRMGFEHQRTLTSSPPLWYNSGCIVVVRILWTQLHSNSCVRWSSSYRSGTRRLLNKHVLGATECCFTS